MVPGVEGEGEEGDEVEAVYDFGRYQIRHSDGARCKQVSNMIICIQGLLLLECTFIGRTPRRYKACQCPIIVSKDRSLCSKLSFCIPLYRKGDEIGTIVAKPSALAQSCSPSCDPSTEARGGT